MSIHVSSTESWELKTKYNQIIEYLKNTCNQSIKQLEDIKKNEHFYKLHKLDRDDVIDMIYIIDEKILPKLYEH